MHDPTTAQSRELHKLFDHAEAILVDAMPAPIARAIIDLARVGAAAPIDADMRAHPHELADDHEPLITTREAAAQLRVSDKQVYRLVEQGRLKRYGAGHAHRFRASDISALLAMDTGSGRRAVRDAMNARGDSPHAA